jgi:DNA (cytosine-5)-methyltransferase 1
MAAYYNEIDPYAAGWLKNLIRAGHIADGVVDERSIVDVDSADLADFVQCHFFAGIGVWGHALRQAGWADDRPVWTGSCPCQPFSAAGKQEGFADERHLWPTWFNLISQCRPAIVLGEQVANALDWLDLVSTDMESAGYAFGAADLCAAGFGGAHIRQRLYFTGVADTLGSGRQRTGGQGSAQSVGTAERGGTGGLADAEIVRRGQGFPNNGWLRSRDCAEGQAGRPSINGGLGDRPHAPMLGRDAADWLYCRDDKWRPVEPGTFPLADAATSRVGRLRAYGNALDAQTATQFVAAVMDCAP